MVLGAPTPVLPDLVGVYIPGWVSCCLRRCRFQSLVSNSEFTPQPFLGSNGVRFSLLCPVHSMIHGKTLGTNSFVLYLCQIWFKLDQCFQMLLMGSWEKYTFLDFLTPLKVRLKIQLIGFAWSMVVNNHGNWHSFFFWLSQANLMLCEINLIGIINNKLVIPYSHPSLGEKCHRAGRWLDQPFIMSWWKEKEKKESLCILTVSSALYN